MVNIVDIKPHYSAVKQKVCGNCGATLEYVPADIRKHISTDYTGSKDIDNVIDCPQCGEMLFV